jgi:dTDP-4-dehydrorhamnose reductase
MRVLVTGAAGQLGAVISDLLESGGHPVRRTDRAELDVTDHVAVMRAVADVDPSVIVNCTAFNDVDGAEERVAEALEINAFAVRSLARAARERGALLVHYGTDFVFEGEPARSEPYTEEDRPDPQSVYGSSKLLGEWFAGDAPRHYVFRVESLFGGPAARSSVDKIIDALAGGRQAPVFEDRVVSPSLVHDVARATLSAIERNIPHGLYHCVNGGSATWLELGREIARLGGFDAGLLVPVKVADVKLRAKRPQYCALSNGKLAGAGVTMPPWQEAVAAYFRSRAVP